MKSHRFCALFDLDDPLVATGPSITYAVNQATAPATVRWRGRVPAEMVAAANEARARVWGLPPLAEPDFWKMTDRYSWPAFEEAVGEGRALVPGVRELVESLLAAGASAAVVTNSRRARAQRLLDMSGLHDLGMAMVCYDDGHGAKPGAGPYHAALRAAGVGSPSRAVFFGDDVTDFRGTANAGIAATVRVLPEGEEGLAGARVAVRDYRGITAGVVERFVETGEFRI